jgi:hypothetical protein
LSARGTGPRCGTIGRWLRIATSKSVSAWPFWKRGCERGLAPFQLQQHETRIWAILKTGLDDGDPAAAGTAMTVISLCIAEGPDLRGILHSS